MEYNNGSELSSPTLVWRGIWEDGVVYCNNDSDNLGISSTVVSESFHSPIRFAGAGFAPFASTCGDGVDDVVVTRKKNTVFPNSSPGDQMINLSLGSQPPSAGERLPPTKKNDGVFPASPAKRSRASYQNMQNPCCQVEGCDLNLKSAKDYHRRHRICEAHSKSPKVVVGGFVRRFCQQCSRFHDLSEFDDKKRSCRKRLSDHNARRRRLPPPESLHRLSSSAAALPSALYAQCLHENASTSYYMPRQTRESSSPSLMGPLKIGPGLEETARFPSDEIPHAGSANNRLADQGMQLAARAGFSSVRSLLSSNSWYPSDPSSSSVVNSNNAPAMNNNGGSPEMKRWSNSGGVVAVDQALMDGGEGGASASSSVQEHGGCFLFQPKGFF